MSFEKVVSACVVLPPENIDTDQIIPARFLSTLDRGGLATGLFAGLRVSPDCPLNDPSLRHARVLVAGRNFGCGSSREHAVWALIEWGFRVVIAPSFGDIFKANALKNGLLPVEVQEAFWRRLVSGGSAEIAVDLEGLVVAAGGQRCHFAIEPFARRCLLDGVDELGYLLDRLPQIAVFEREAR